MIVLCKGEGPSDIGRVYETLADLKTDYGAMGALILQILAACRGALYKCDEYKIVPDSCINRYKNEKPDELEYLSKSKYTRFRGIKHKEIFFQTEARCLGLYAKKISNDEDVIAILFHDADQTHTRNDAVAKRKSIYDGFESADFHEGIAMMPEPTSEAWLLLMFGDNEYMRIARNTTDGDRLKRALQELMNRRNITLDDIYDMIRDGRLKTKTLCGNSSFDCFNQRICYLLSERLHNQGCFGCPNS